MYTMTLLDKINKPEAESSGGDGRGEGRGGVRGRSSPLFDLERNAFICPLCSKPFPTTQALGGHQNAQRRRRAKERWMSAETRRMKAKESTRNIPCPKLGRRRSASTTHDCQMVDFWALELAKPEDRVAQDEELQNEQDETGFNNELPCGEHGSYYDENQNYHHHHHLNYVNGYEERDLVAMFGHEEFQTEAISTGRYHGGGHFYEYELIACNREPDLTLRL